jgi:calcium-dependent protein kinase
LRAEIRNEIDILRRLDHPNIIRLYETFEESNNIYLVLELCSGGDLYERTYTEADTILVIQQLLRAVSYLHEKNIIHRDLKFENILFENKSRNAGIKLIDFGLSKMFKEGETMDEAIGTIYSMAPEVLAGSYTESADIWSVGVLAFMLLCGELPFDGGNDDEILAKIERGDYKYSNPKVHVAAHLS